MIVLGGHRCETGQTKGKGRKRNYRKTYIPKLSEGFRENRTLLIETCIEHRLIITNTIQTTRPQTSNMQGNGGRTGQKLWPRTRTTNLTLDHLIVPKRWRKGIFNVEAEHLANYNLDLNSVWAEVRCKLHANEQPANRYHTCTEEQTEELRKEFSQK